MDMTETQFFEDMGSSNALAIRTPIDSLCSDYRKKKADIERIAAYASDESGIIDYFLSGALVEGNGTTLTASRLFQADHAIRALDATFWSRAMALTDVLNYMPQDKRQKWHEQIHKHKTPAFEPETVEATLRDLLAQRQHFFAERIDGIFRALSGSHITNSPAGFGKRMILSGITSSWGSTDRVGYINDLRCVIAKFMGRDEPKWDASNQIVADARHMRGEWVTLDGGALRLRCYLRGTAHLEVHPDMAWRLNAVLSSLYPAAIPPEFRRKPAKAKKAPKDFVMMGRPLPFAVLELLAAMRTAYRHIKQEGNWRQPFRSEEIRNAMQLDYSAYAVQRAPAGAKEEAERVLAYIGAVRDPGGWWQFEYAPQEVIREIVRTGCLPDRKTHQYYPTSATIGKDVADLAQIADGDDCLEPSAGQGGIAEFLPKDRTTCVEISPLHCKVLEGKGFNTICADFLEWVPGRKFRKIVMNPPFSEGRAESHLLRASELLADQGRLVAVLPAGLKGKELVPGFEHQWCKTYQGEFAGTSVSVVTLVLTRR